MSWRWVIDARDGDIKVDWPKAVVALLFAVALSSLMFSLVPSPWNYGVLVLWAAVAIAVDVRLRKDRG